MRWLILVAGAFCSTVVLSGCQTLVVQAIGAKAKYEAASLNPEAKQALFDAFRAGNAVMDCFGACAGRWGYNRSRVKQLHDSAQWEQLAREVLYIGYGNDLAWYYLARAAEGLGYLDAARIYYKKSIAAEPCGGVLVNNCDGFAFPVVSERRLANLNAVTAPPRVAPTPPSPEQSNLVLTGTGFLVDRRGHVLTNNHVIDGCNSLKVTGETFSESPKVVAADSSNDLALLKLSAPPLAIATFRADWPVRSGEPVVIVGYPLRGILASEAIITTGVVSALAGIGDDTRFLQMTAPVQPGNSGGPLLDGAGNIVGIVVAKLNAIQMVGLTGDIPENVNFAIKASVAQAFLEAHGVDYQTTPSTRKMESADIAEQARKFTVVIECRKGTADIAKEGSSTIPGQSEDPKTRAMRIASGKKVSLEYTLTLEDGSRVDSNVGKDPLVFTQGAHEIIPGLENQLVGLKAGDSKRIEVLPEEGYGRFDPDRKQEVDKNIVPAGARKVGAKLTGQGPEGQPIFAQVAEVKESTIVLDLNHPLAGKKLIFGIKVLKVEDAGR